MTVRVIVTRPEPGLSRTTVRLARAGFDPVPLPLFRVVARPEQVLQAASARGDVHVVTSANALRATAGRINKSAPLYVVGPATAAEARAQGYQTIVEGTGDAATLAGMLVETRGTAAAKPLRYVYLAGARRTSALEACLQAHDLLLQVFEVYGTEPIQYARDALDDALDDALGAGRRMAVMFFSAEAGRRFVEIAQTVEITGRADARAFVCISQSVAETLPAGFAGERLVAAAPDEEAMVEALRAWRNR